MPIRPGSRSSSPSTTRRRPCRNWSAWSSQRRCPHGRRPRDHLRQRLLEGRHRREARRAAGALPRHRVPDHPQAGERGQGRRPARRVQAGDRATSSSSRTRTWNTTPQDYLKLLQPIVRRQGRRRLRQPVHRRAAPRPVFLAHAREQVADAPQQHVHQPEPDRHGGLLQGLPQVGAASGSRSSATASASSRRSPPRSPSSARACGSTRSASPTTAAATRRARRSPGRMASRRS